ncbi:hypothetical protein PIB30_080031, partial [Stylosanthes scabra]|nr:hypothetical protein [Stylosanthes scabra]
LGRRWWILKVVVRLCGLGGVPRCFRRWWLVGAEKRARWLRRGWKDDGPRWWRRTKVNSSVELSGGSAVVVVICVMIELGSASEIMYFILII